MSTRCQIGIVRAPNHFVIRRSTMTRNKPWSTLIRLSILPAVIAVAGGVTQSRADGPERGDAPRHFAGLLDDYTPSAAVVKGGPYEMRGKWTLDLDRDGGAARFEASMNMETSDYGITQGTVDKDNPATRSAHTHHIKMTDGVVSDNWASCPAFSPSVVQGFVVTGTAYITGNGGPAPFGALSPVTICVLGGDAVHFSNLTITLGAPANKHFGVQPIHGVVSDCRGHWDDSAPDCSVQD
jgi:hypothetical protein